MARKSKIDDMTQQYDAALGARDQHFDAVDQLEVVHW
jgi:hypothetical protein